MEKHQPGGIRDENALDDNTLMNMYDFELMEENKIYPLHEKENEAGIFTNKLH